jgi:hypothetical protein
MNPEADSRDTVLPSSGNLTRRRTVHLTMARVVPFVEASIENWCPGCKDFHLGPKHYPYKLRLIQGGKAEPLRVRRRRGR